MAKKSRPVVPLGGEGTGLPLYLVHSIGGEVIYYRPLAERIGGDRKIYGIQAPKEKMSGAFAETIHGLAEYYLENLTQFQPQGPLLLGGWSSGAPIALEMAQMLKAAGRPVPLLIIFDGLLFNCGGKLSPWHPLYQWKLLRNLPLWIAENIFQGWGVRGSLIRLRRELKLNFESLIGRRQKGPGSSVDAFMDTSALPPEQADFARALGRAVEIYEPKPYDGDTLVYTARSQPLLHLLQVDTTWQAIARRCKLVYVDGNHVTLMKEPYVDQVAGHLGPRLAEFREPEQSLGESQADPTTEKAGN